MCFLRESRQSSRTRLVLLSSIIQRIERDRCCGSLVDSYIITSYSASEHDGFHWIPLQMMHCRQSIHHLVISTNDISLLLGATCLKHQQMISIWPVPKLALFSSGDGICQPFTECRAWNSFLLYVNMSTFYPCGFGCNDKKMPLLFKA